MKQHAEERIADLKERGYQNAGLYDPPGVGGTHVMYVLQHARPARAVRLAEGPEDQPDGERVEGHRQAAGAGGARAGGAGLAFFHYMTVGPNEVEEDEEETR